MRRRAWWFAAASVLLLGACARPPDVGTDAATGSTVDWISLDRALIRRSLEPYSRWFCDAPTDRLIARRATLAFAAPMDSLGLTELQSRPLAEQRSRRREAARLLDRAMLIIQDRAERVRDDGVSRRADRFVYLDLHATLDQVLRLLHTAVGMDPELAEAWAGLAYFGAAIGDEATASRARRAFLERAVTADAHGRALTARVVLDEAWALREAGHHPQCHQWLDAHRGLLDAAPPTAEALPPRIERDLIVALLSAESGDRSGTQRHISRLPLVPVQHHTRTRQSAYLRTWVRAWLELSSGNPDGAAQAISRQPATRRHSAVDWRFWQDLGHVADACGDRVEARRAWGLALGLRPFLGFFPQAILQVPPEHATVAGSDAPFGIAYRTHFLGGSAWGFAVTRALLCQVVEPDQDPLLWREAMLALDRCVRRGDRAGQARLLRARLHLQRGDVDAAEADLRSGAVTRLAAGADEAEVMFLRGIAASRRGDLARALPLLERAAASAPDNPRAWQALSVSLAFLGRHDDALRAFDTVVRLAPRDGAAWFNRGLFHLQHGRREQAEQDLLSALRFLPDDTRVVQLLQAIATGREVVVDASMPVIELVASERERALASSLETVMEGDAEAVLATLGESPEERAGWLELLERRYLQDGDPDDRRLLAEARHAGAEHAGVQRLLAPAWPDGLSPRERLLLILADRADGQPARARALAADPPGWMEPELVVAVVILLHDVGDAAEAATLLAEGRRRWPEHRGLSELAGRLP